MRLTAGIGVIISVPPVCTVDSSAAAGVTEADAVLCVVLSVPETVPATLRSEMLWSATVSVSAPSLEPPHAANVPARARDRRTAKILFFIQQPPEK